MRSGLKWSGLCLLFFLFYSCNNPFHPFGDPVAKHQEEDALYLVSYSLLGLETDDGFCPSGTTLFVIGSVNCGPDENNATLISTAAGTTGSYQLTKSGSITFDSDGNTNSQIVYIATDSSGTPITATKTTWNTLDTLTVSLTAGQSLAFYYEETTCSDNSGFVEVCVTFAQ